MTRISAERVAEVLAGGRGNAGVRGLFTSPDARAALRAQVASMLMRPQDLGRFRLRRAKFKPDRYARGWYDVAVASVAWPIAATWLPAALAAPDGEPGSRPGEPFARLASNGGQLEVLAWPYDPEFPHLAALSDPTHVAALFDGRRRRVRAVRYRPGERHVLRYDQAGVPTLFAKLYRDGRSAPAAHLASQVADHLASRPGGVLAVRPESHLEAEDALLFRRVPGRALAAAIRRGDAVYGHLQRAGQALRHLHGAPAELARGLPEQTITSEARAVTRAAEHVSALVPRVGARIARLLERASAAATDVDAPGFVHGDFKADHLLVAGETLHLIDFDTCRRGDPAADLGKFLADLHWWAPGDESARAAFVTGYAPDGAGSQRARVWEAVIGTKIALRRTPIVAPAWAELLDRSVARAEALLS